MLKVDVKVLNLILTSLEFSFFGGAVCYKNLLSFCGISLYSAVTEFGINDSKDD